jgi:hypothetical protein
MFTLEDFNFFADGINNGSGLVIRGYMYVWHRLQWGLCLPNGNIVDGDFWYMITKYKMDGDKVNFPEISSNIVAARGCVVRYIRERAITEIVQELPQPLYEEIVPEIDWEWLLELFTIVDGHWWKFMQNGEFFIEPLFWNKYSQM